MNKYLVALFCVAFGAQVCATTEDTVTVSTTTEETTVAQEIKAIENMNVTEEIKTITVTETTIANDDK